MKNILLRKFTTESKRDEILVYAIKNTNVEMRDILRKLFSKEAKRPTAA